MHQDVQELTNLTHRTQRCSSACVRCKRSFTLTSPPSRLSTEIEEKLSSGPDDALPPLLLALVEHDSSARCGLPGRLEGCHPQSALCVLSPGLTARPFSVPRALSRFPSHRNAPRWLCSLTPCAVHLYVSTNNVYLLFRASVVQRYVSKGVEFWGADENVYWCKLCVTGAKKTPAIASAVDKGPSREPSALAARGIGYQPEKTSASPAGEQTHFSQIVSAF